MNEIHILLICLSKNFVTFTELTNKFSTVNNIYDALFPHNNFLLFRQLKYTNTDYPQINSIVHSHLENLSKNGCHFFRKPTANDSETTFFIKDTLSGENICKLLIPIL